MDEEADRGSRSDRRNRLPRNRQRERVLRLVREHGEAIDAVELAARIGAHVTTARFHLDALCDEGAIERTRINREGVGRPRTGYRAVEERLDYRILAGILAMELGDTVESRAQRAQRAGRHWADRIAGLPGESLAHHNGADACGSVDALDRGAVLTTAVFDRMGFDPELAEESAPMASLSTDSAQIVGRERVIRLRGCPVRDLARSNPEVSCGVHLGLLQGLLDHATSAGSDSSDGSDQEGRRLSARLDPFVEPELCIARLSASRRAQHD